MLEKYDPNKQYTLADVNNILARMTLQSEIDKTEWEKSIQESRLEWKESIQEERLLRKESDLAWEKRMQEADKRMKNMEKLYGGISKSNGAMAEDYFFDALSDKYELAGIKYSTADRNIHRKTKQMECEYDIVLYNSHKIIVVEVKYNLHINCVREFYEEKLPKFKKLYPEYRGYKIIGAVAAMTIEEDSLQLAKEYGFLVLTQKNKHLNVLNDKDFHAKEY
jgi:hypothetical protein